jgi:hypothetical protein
VIVSVVPLKTLFRLYAWGLWAALIVTVLAGLFSLAHAPEGTVDRVLRGEPRDPPLHTPQPRRTHK